MKELEESFIGKGEVKGFKFTLLMSNPRGFMYEVVNGNLVYYEVFLRKVHSVYGHVMYPRSKSFGVWAWSVFGYDKALGRFERL